MKFSFYKIAIAVCLLGGAGWWFTSHQSDDKITTDKNMIRYMPDERWKAEFEMLKDPATGEIPKGIRQKEMKAALKVKEFRLRPSAFDKSLPSIMITSKGPNNYGGRTRALGFDVRNSNIVISGGVSSGIFRSINGGTSWTKVTPAGQIHNLTCLAQDTRSGFEDIWYAGTGEKLGNSAGAGDDSAEYLGHGMWKSTDNGLTWTALASTQGDLYSFDNGFDYISRIVVDPTNGAVLAAVSETIERSTDGGTTWTNVLGTVAAGQIGDIIYNANASKFYAAINGQAANNSGIWTSANGIAWTVPTNAPAILSDGSSKRIILSNVANTSSILVMYELVSAHNCGGVGTSEVGLEKFDGTSTWTDYTENISDCAGGSTAPKQITLQSGYNMCLTTKPNDANYVYLGGTEIYRFNMSTNAYDFIGGSQQGANTVNLHVDNHILMFDPNNNDMIWAGNDGGLRKTNVTGTIKTILNDPDNGYTWTARTTNYETYQYYDADISPVNGSTFVGGAAQDNAFTIHPTTAQALEVGPTADGTSIAIISGTSFTNFSVLASWQNGGLVRLDSGVDTYITPDQKKQGFHSIIFLDADNTSLLYYPYTTDNNVASNGLLRTRNATAIADGTISNDPTANWQDMTGVKAAITGSISTFEVSRNESFSGAAYTASNASRKLYFGTNDGKVYRLNDPAFAAASATPVNITPGTATGYVSDIAVNPYDDKEILVTYSNYGIASVWHTADASVASPNWTNVEGATGTAVEIASARSAMIVKANGTLVYMVGTSTGLYATDALSGASTVWTRVGAAEIALSVCVEMRLRTSDNKMIVGTHGNGLFLLEFPAALPVELTSFEGKATSNGNLLNWTTASEEDNKGFDIERSSDGKRFNKIGFVAGNGTSLQRQTYEFLDKSPNEGTAYYRLKQVDFNGKFEYSKIVSISNKALVAKPLALYPNPVRDNLTIENGEGKATIRTIDGKVMMQVNVNSEKQNVDVSNLPNGIYVLSIQKPNGSAVTRKFVK
jgi:hypothetical protein